jgi:hypothetical protein
MIQALENADNRVVMLASEGYEIRVDSVGFADHELSFDPYLFNRSEHLVTQRRKNPVSIGLRRIPDHRIAAVLHLDQRGAEALSPSQAPFGGMQAISGLSPKILACVLEASDDWCRAYKVGRIVIRTHPEAYDEGQSALLKSVYVRCGFTPTATHLNHHIPVTATSFEIKIRPSERRRLRKCVRAGFTAEIWQDPDPNQVYAFLAESRQRQRYPLSLDFAQLSLLLTQLPQQALVFVVKDQTEIVSLTVGIRVNSKILYNFCPADNLDYRSYSPMVLLNGYLYEYAQRTGIELIDLGVSLDHLGHEKASLIRFKENLGAEKSEKVTYEKVF